MFFLVSYSGLFSGANKFLNAFVLVTHVITSSGFKAGKPFYFDGMHVCYQSWRVACTLYLHANSKDINMDEQQIIFMLSYMQGGHVGAWKDHYTLKNYVAGAQSPTASK